MRSERSPGQGRVRCQRALAALMIVASCSSTPTGLPDATDLERRGETAIAEHHPDEARALFYASMRERDRPFLAWIGVARASIDLGDLTTAETAVAQALRFDYGSAAAADLIGRTALMLAQARGRNGRGQAIVAASMLARARGLDPTIKGLWYHQGLAHLSANEPQIAEPLLRRAWAESPGSPDVLRALMTSWRRLSAPTVADEWLEALVVAGTLPVGFEEDLQWAREGAASRAASRPASRQSTR